MRVLFLTYKYAESDTLVGSVVGVVKGLAESCEWIHVLCLAADPTTPIPPRVTIHSLGKNEGSSRWRRAEGWIQTVQQLWWQIDIIYAQFSPDYVLALLLWLLVKPKPIALWYTHREVSWRLRLALRLVTRVFTASESSFGIPSPKVRILGHGINTHLFTPPTARPPSPVILAVGRLAPIKEYEILIDAISLIPNFTGLVQIVGGVEGDSAGKYPAQLRARIEKAGLQGVIRLVGAVSYQQLPAFYQNAWVHVNLCQTGGLDKAVLEGLACGVPTMVRNRGFAPYLAPLEAAAGMSLLVDTASELAAKLELVLQWDSARWEWVHAAARKVACERASQESFTQRLAIALREIKL